VRAIEKWLTGAACIVKHGYVFIRPVVVVVVIVVAFLVVRADSEQDDDLLRDF